MTKKCTLIRDARAKLLFANLRACLHGGRGPQGGEVTRLGGVTCLSMYRFSKVPIINGPGKLSPFTLKIEVSIVLHLT